MTSPPRKRDPQATTRRILAAARTLMTEGDGHFEMSWVAKAAGVSQGLAYHHFGSKEGLLSAVVDDFYDRVEHSVLMARLEEIEDWESRERERTRRYIQFLIEDDLAAIIITQLGGTPAVAAVENARWQMLIATGAKNMAEGQRTGAIEAGQDPRLLAAMTLGAVRSAVASAFSSEQPADPRQLTDDIWHFVRAGLGLPPAP